MTYKPTKEEAAKIREALINLAAIYWYDTREGEYSEEVQKKLLHLADQYLPCVKKKEQIVTSDHCDLSCHCKKDGHDVFCCPIHHRDCYAVRDVKSIYERTLNQIKFRW